MPPFFLTVYKTGLGSAQRNDKKLLQLFSIHTICRGFTDISVSCQRYETVADML